MVGDKVLFALFSFLDENAILFLVFRISFYIFRFGFEIGVLHFLFVYAYGHLFVNSWEK